jgi:hypothetical protein
MYRSSWDVEVYARDVQERRMREVARARLIAEAEFDATPMRPRGLEAAVAAFVAAVREWLAPTGRIRRGLLGQTIKLPVVSEKSTE